MHSGYTEIVRLLIEFGARIDVQNYVEETPMHFAAANNDTTCIELLLKVRNWNIEFNSELTASYMLMML